ncbi:hypothetical protein FHS20_002347 [Phyllobacterium endophyticum]|nr:hypothetical protein [Phyllobacterium endophyticum]
MWVVCKEAVRIPKAEVTGPNPVMRLMCADVAVADLQTPYANAMLNTAFRVRCFQPEIKTLPGSTQRPVKLRNL